MPQEFLKHAVTDYLVRSTDFFSLRLSNKRRTTANTTIAVKCECPVLNYKYVSHIVVLHFIGPLTNKVVSDWLVFGTRNLCIQV